MGLWLVQGGGSVLSAWSKHVHIQYTVVTHFLVLTDIQRHFGSPGNGIKSVFAYTYTHTHYLALRPSSTVNIVYSTWT